MFYSKLVFIILVTFITSSTETSDSDNNDGTASLCNITLDIGFIIDSSYSIKDNYKNQKTFIKELASRFGVGLKSRAGVITYSDTAIHSIKLNDFKTINNFNEAVDKIGLIGAYTSMDKALRLAQKQMFTSSNGGRNGMPKLLIFLTDGLQTTKYDYEDPSLIADELRKSGVEVQVVSMGRNIDVKDLIKIAGEEANLFKAETFDVLADESFIQRIVFRTCNKDFDIPQIKTDKYIYLEGDTMTLECVSNTSNIPVTYSWIHDGVATNLNTKIVVIENVKTKNQGIYQCKVATSFMGSKTSPVKFVIIKELEKPTVSIEKPTISMTSISQSNDYLNLTFACLHEEDPSITVQWQSSTELQNENISLLKLVYINESVAVQCLLTHGLTTVYSDVTSISYHKILNEVVNLPLVNEPTQRTTTELMINDPTTVVLATREQTTLQRLASSNRQRLVLSNSNTCMEGINQCHEHASCYNVNNEEYMCKCNHGYEGNGVTCDKNSNDCQTFIYIIVTLVLLLLAALCIMVALIVRYRKHEKKRRRKSNYSISLEEDFIIPEQRYDEKSPTLAQSLLERNEKLEEEEKINGIKESNSNIYENEHGN